MNEVEMILLCIAFDLIVRWTLQSVLVEILYMMLGQATPDRSQDRKEFE